VVEPTGDEEIVTPGREKKEGAGQNEGKRAERAVNASGRLQKTKTGWGK